jgi:6-phosphofructokinase 1
VRKVDVSSEQYKIARRYMVRLRPEDFHDAETLAKMASVTHMQPDEFRRRFGYLVEESPAQEPQAVPA